MKKTTRCLALVVLTGLAVQAFATPAERAGRIDRRLDALERNGAWEQGSRRDRAEDRFDRFEDRLDRREDRLDRRVDNGRPDRLEDRRDRAENVRDRRENRRDRGAGRRRASIE